LFDFFHPFLYFRKLAKMANRRCAAHFMLASIILAMFLASPVAAARPLGGSRALLAARPVAVGSRALLAKRATVLGTLTDDTLAGTAGADIIKGKAGA
jgi:hypothetical protein